MPETREITVYTFNELSDKAKERALMKHAEWLDDDWATTIIDDYKDTGAKRGFKINDVRYSISYSQGDGAAWQGSFDVLAFLDHHLKPDHPDHARYIVLMELLRGDWVVLSPEVSYTGFRYHTMSASLGISWTAWDSESVKEGGPVLEDGVLAGASVVTLAESIHADGLVVDLEEWVNEETRAFSSDLYDALRTEYEYQTSAECFAELADANEWRFDENGALV